MNLPKHTGLSEAAERSPWALLLLTLAFTWLAMGPCLNNGFVNWDEQAYILDNHKIRSLSLERVKEIFSSTDIKMYSPLSTLSYAVNYHFGGLEPRFYHATNLALHLANTALVMWLVRLLFPGAWTAFFVALLFGIHPAHVESVAWAAERKDVLYSFFYLSSMIAYARRPGGTAAWLVSLALFACALLSKPMAVTLPGALLLVDYLKSEKISRRQWLDKLPFFALAGIFSLLTLSGGGMQIHWAKRLVLPFYNLGFYLYTLAWPFNLSAMYVEAPGGRTGIILGGAATLAGILLLWRYLRRDKETVFGAAFFALMLLPVLQFFPFGPVISADRYTYLSSIGVFSAAAVWARRLWLRPGRTPRRAMMAVAACALLLLAVTARVRCGVWKSGFSLWSDTLEKQPSAGPALSNLCGTYLKNGMLDQAGTCFGLAIRMDPGAAENYSNMCYLHYRRRDYDLAERYCLSALRINQRDANAINKLGDIHLARGDVKKARRHYGWTLICDRNFVPAYRSLGRLALKDGDRQGAAAFFSKALALEPGDPESLAALESIKKAP